MEMNSNLKKSGRRFQYQSLFSLIKSITELIIFVRSSRLPRPKRVCEDDEFLFPKM